MTDLREAGPLLPDDMLAELSRRYGDVQLAAYASLAKSRGLPLREVLAYAVEDRLAQAIALPVVSGGEESHD